MDRDRSNETAKGDAAFSPIAWRDGGLWLFEQTLLPAEEKWIECPTPEVVADAIYRLAVRGAPAIGISAAYGLVVGLKSVERAEDLDARFEARRPSTRRRGMSVPERTRLQAAPSSRS